MKRMKFSGMADQAAQFLQREQLMDAALWKKFVDVFHTRPDGENHGWRGEYWGKMMRGAVLVYEYTRDEQLYAVLEDTVQDMLCAADPNGCVSSYKYDQQFDSWDLWCRKYVMLGLEYFYDVCRSEDLKFGIVRFLCRCADYILLHIGRNKGKITSASRSWYGLNSSSILEPMVRLHLLTQEQRYLDFAAYIVEEGGAEGINVFELAYENRLFPYQCGVSKAYEMMSCFEGLLWYYRATGVEKYKTAVVNFANAVLGSEISIIGSCGVTHELFDHTRTRQTVHYDGVMQETCVTVTWMKFCALLLEETGDSRYADAMEQAFYNAYLGAINTEKCESAHPLRHGAESTYLAFDSYSPLTPGKRGQKVGGFQILPDRSYYGCCACIGAAGAGVFLDSMVTQDEKGITVNFYERGQVDVVHQGERVRIGVDTAYPVDGRVRLQIQAEQPVKMAIRLRNPGWSDHPGGYTRCEKKWQDDVLDLCFDMPIRLHTPERWEEDVVYTDMSVSTPMSYVAGPVRVQHQESEDCYVAYTRGPLTLAADSRAGKDAGSAFIPTCRAEVCAKEITPGVPCQVKLRFTPEGGDCYELVDYASAGRDWQTTIAAWLPTR